MIDNRPCRIYDVKTSKGGKNKYQYKVKLIGIDCIDLSKHELIAAAHAMIDTFEPNKTIYELYDIEDKEEDTIVILKCISETDNIVHDIVIKKDETYIKLCDLKKAINSDQILKIQVGTYPIMSADLNSIVFINNIDKIGVWFMHLFQSDVE